MKPTFFKGAAVGAATCFVMLAGTAALAGTGVGDVFNLGRVNTVDQASTLTGNAGTAPELAVENTGTGPAIRGDSVDGRGVLGRHRGATGIGAGLTGETASTDPAGVAVRAQNTGAGSALNLIVANASAPPLRVNSSAVVPGLNADLLDGKSSSGFYAAGSTVADSDQLDGPDSAAFAQKCQTGAVKGYVHWLPATNFPSTYSDDFGLFERYNCTGGPILVKRVKTGHYRLKLPGLNYTLGVGMTNTIPQAVDAFDTFVSAVHTSENGEPVLDVVIRRYSGTRVDGFDAVTMIFV